MFFRNFRIFENFMFFRNFRIFENFLKFETLKSASEASEAAGIN